MHAYIRRQSYAGSAQMVYALSVLIILSALYALLYLRFSESRSDLFPILSFPLATVG
jgi:hypothetical protein